MPPRILPPRRADGRFVSTRRSLPPPPTQKVVTGRKRRAPPPTQKVVTGRKRRVLPYIPMPRPPSPTGVPRAQVVIIPTAKRPTRKSKSLLTMKVAPKPNRGRRRQHVIMKWGHLTAPRAVEMGVGAVGGAAVVGGASWMLQALTGSPLLATVGQAGGVLLTLAGAMLFPSALTTGVFVGAVASAVTANAKRMLDAMGTDSNPAPVAEVGAMRMRMPTRVPTISGTEDLALVLGSPVWRAMARANVARTIDDPNIAEPSAAGDGSTEPSAAVGRVDPTPVMPDTGPLLDYDGQVVPGVGRTHYATEDSYAALQRSLG